MKTRLCSSLNLTRAVFAVAMLAIAAGTLAQTNDNDNDLDAYFAKKEAARKNWQESAYTLPPAPQDSDLATYPVSATTTLTFAVDTKTLTTTPDGLVRFTSVITSPQGARNVTFEGIRCETYEYRIYATGNPDGTWIPSRDTAWHRIRGYSANGYQGALYRDYFCENKLVRGSAKTIAHNLRYPQRISQ